MDTVTGKDVTIRAQDAITELRKLGYVVLTREEAARVNRVLEQFVATGYAIVDVGARALLSPDEAGDE